jgi:predicted TIM-barrel fold metal-dependent hydrolase
MPLQSHMKLISVDDHLVEHASVWEDRLPEKMREAGPRIRKLDREGGPPADVWFYEGREYPQIGLNAVAGKRPEEYGLDPVRYADMIPGCYDPKARLVDMDLDGVWGAMCFPSFPRFAGTVFLEGQDRDLALACVRAYNDFVLQEWCATAPDRLVPVVIMPLWDADSCISEVHRTAAMGAKAISFPENPVPLGLPSFHTTHWDGFLSAAEETAMPLCMHFGSSGSPPQTAPEAPFAVAITLFACNSMAATTDLIFSPVFHRHPNLKIGLSEGGIGWIPYILERADYVWERHRYYQNVVQDVRPSDLFRRHIHGCFISDEHGVGSRHEIGIQNITWECDYPHSDSNWPNSRKVAIEVFQSVPDEEVHDIVERNTRRLYNLSAA